MRLMMIETQSKEYKFKSEEKIEKFKNQIDDLSEKRNQLECHILKFGLTQ
jgi:hypothetical protein